MLHPTQTQLPLSNHEGKGKTHALDHSNCFCHFLSASLLNFAIQHVQTICSRTEYQPQVSGAQFRQDPGSTVFVGIEGRLDSFYKATLEHLGPDNCTVLYDENEVSHLYVLDCCIGYILY